MSDEFYIGYQKQAPPGMAGMIRRTALSVAVACVAVAILVAAIQRPQEDGAFEFGVSKSFEGVLYESPLPMIHVTTPTEGATELLLVGFGKQGMPAFSRGNGGKKVRFTGSLIYRDAMTMIEMNDPESFEVLGDPNPNEHRADSISLGSATITGELVDTKCFFGVMRPGTGKVHRACAINCLKGGVPPGLLVRGEKGTGTVIMLAGADGAKLDYDVEWAALDVTASGELTLQESMPVLHVSSLRLANTAIGAAHE
jgi:hypothetical protein